MGQRNGQSEAQIADALNCALFCKGKFGGEDVHCPRKNLGKRLPAHAVRFRRLGRYQIPAQKKAAWSTARKALGAVCAQA